MDPDVVKTGLAIYLQYLRNIQAVGVQIEQHGKALQHAAESVEKAMNKNLQFDPAQARRYLAALQQQADAFLLMVEATTEWVSAAHREQ